MEKSLKNAVERSQQKGHYASRYGIYFIWYWVGATVQNGGSLESIEWFDSMQRSSISYSFIYLFLLHFLAFVALTGRFLDGGCATTTASAVPSLSLPPSSPASPISTSPSSCRLLFPLCATTLLFSFTTCSASRSLCLHVTSFSRVIPKRPVIILTSTSFNPRTFNNDGRPFSFLKLFRAFAWPSKVLCPISRTSFSSPSQDCKHCHDSAMSTVAVITTTMLRRFGRDRLPMAPMNWPMARGSRSRIWFLP